MNQSYIKVPDMLEAMKETLASGKPRAFRIGYLTADRQRKKGGEYRTMKATLSRKGRKSGSTSHRTINVQPQGTQDTVLIHFDNILYFNDHPVS